jgi:hypothetical protein
MLVGVVVNAAVEKCIVGVLAVLGLFQLDDTVGFSLFHVAHVTVFRVLCSLHLCGSDF